MIEAHFLRDLVVLLAASLPIVFLSQQIRLPSLVGFLARLDPRPRDRRRSRRSRCRPSPLLDRDGVLFSTPGTDGAVVLRGRRPASSRNGCAGLPAHPFVRRDLAPGSPFRLRRRVVEYGDRPQDTRRPGHLGRSPRSSRGGRPPVSGPFHRPDDDASAGARSTRSSVSVSPSSSSPRPCWFASEPPG